MISQQELEARLEAEVEEIKADAKRWRQIREYHLTPRQCGADGQHKWTFKPIRHATGPTADAVIDREIELFSIWDQCTAGTLTCKQCTLKRSTCGSELAKEKRSRKPSQKKEKKQ